MVKSTFLNIVKWIVLIFLVMYIWRAIHKSDHTNHREGYNNIQSSDHSEFDTPLDKTLGDSDSCNECTSSTSVSGGKLLPVMDPCFNMREVCKQSILLEDHLNSKGKDCKDCIRKHFLTIEALCEEAIGLDKEGKYPDIRDLPEKIRMIIKRFISKKNKFEIAQELRTIRKKYMNRYFDAF